MAYNDNRTLEEKKFNLDMYNEYVEPIINNPSRYIEITIPQEKINRIKEFCKEVVEAKKGEKLHKIDSDSEYQRFYSGTLGEAAVEELLGVNIINWKVGKSSFFNVADLSSIGLDIGIKTVKQREGSFPQINIPVKRPEIIVIRPKNEMGKISDNTVRIMGVASVEVLSKYTDKRLRYGSLNNPKRPKWGFYKFDDIQRFETLEELRNI